MDFGRGDVLAPGLLVDDRFYRHIIVLVGMVLSCPFKQTSRGRALTIAQCVSMVTNLECEALRRTAYLEKAEEVLEGRISLRTQHAAQTLLVDLQFSGDFVDGFGGI